MTINEWLDSGAKEFVVVKINRGRKNTHYVLFGKLLGLTDDGEEHDMGMIQVGHIQSSPNVPSYTWMTPEQVRTSYGLKQCRPADEMLVDGGNA